MLRRLFGNNKSPRVLLSRKLHYDVFINGGGVMGSSVAYFLKAKQPNLNIAVCERDSKYTNSSSALSVSSIRQQFSCAENIYLSTWSRNFMRDISNTLAVAGLPHPDIQLFVSSYMFLASCKRGCQILDSNVGVQRDCGSDVRILTKDQLTEKFPWLNVEGIMLGSISEDDTEGWFDGWSLLQAFRKKATSLGVEYINAECTKINATSTVQSVEISKDGVEQAIDCGNYVNAAGAWASELMKNIGIDLPVSPRKRYVFVFDCPKGPGRGMPLSVDPTGVYCRPEGQGTLYLSGCTPEEHEEPDIGDLEVDYSYFYDLIWPTLANRYPAMEELKLLHSWAGYYDYNTFDQNAILGRSDPLLPNLYFANGFSGHGIQQSPAVGNVVSDILLKGDFTDHDLSNLYFNRIREQRPIKEINVV